MQGSWKERGALIPSQMLKGVLQGSVLAILGQRETYGYEIVQALHGYGFGSVSARFMDSDLGPRRKYYTLTDQGRRELAQFRASFREMTAAVERLPGFGEEEMTCGSPL